MCGNILFLISFLHREERLTTKPSFMLYIPVTEVGIRLIWFWQWNQSKMSVARAVVEPITSSNTTNQRLAESMLRKRYFPWGLHWPKIFICTLAKKRVWIQYWFFFGYWYITIFLYRISEPSHWYNNDCHEKRQNFLLQRESVGSPGRKEVRHLDQRQSKLNKVKYLLDLTTNPHSLQSPV